MNDAPPIERLASEPRRFHFDAAVRILLAAAHSADPATAVRFRTLAGLAFPPAEVIACEPANGNPPVGGSRARLTVTHMGLTGAMGVLPRFYSEILASTLRGRSSAFEDFLDLLAQHFIAAFAEARAKYRLNLASERAELGGAEDPIALCLLSLAGYGLPGLAERVEAGQEPLLHYAGLFAEPRRSAERLRALASDWLGRKVEVVQFAGGWLPLPPSEQTRLPTAAGPGRGAWNRLGIDAAIGVRAWNPAARVLLRIGPLDGAGFRAMLPDRPSLRRFVSLVRAFLGFETGFAINLVLARPEVPPLKLDSVSALAPRLGWNTWLPEGIRSTRGPATEAVFAAEVVEAQAGGAG